MKIKTVTLLILAAVISVACGSKDNPITPSISFSGVSNPLSVAAKGVKQSVSLNSSLSWVASADVSWISVSPTSGTGGSGIQVEVSVAENTGEAREGKGSSENSGKERARKENSRNRRERRSDRRQDRRQNRDEQQTVTAAETGQAPQTGRTQHEHAEQAAQAVKPDSVRKETSHE